MHERHPVQIYPVAAVTVNPTVEVCGDNGFECRGENGCECRGDNGCEPCGIDDCNFSLEVNNMSVTVSDLLKLPSLQQSKVLGGRGGLTKVVSSISVLESTDPAVLVNEVFPHDKYAGGEIVITGFINCVDDIDLQCSNIMRLIEGGEVGLVLYYVGMYLPRVDQRLIDIADEYDFVLICMPEGQRHLRYSDLIKDVMECIFKDRSTSISLVADILARISSLPHHQQTVSTALQMLCAGLGCSAVLSTHEGNILNLSSWPSGMEEMIREGIENCLPFSMVKERIPCPFLSEAEMYCLPIRSDLAQPLCLTLIKVGAPLTLQLTEQAAETVRICINIWERQHGTVAIHELLRSILQDEPLKMRRLAEIFHVDIASIHELWMLCGANADEAEAYVEHYLAMARQCADTVIGDVFEGIPLMCLSTPHSLKETENVLMALQKDAQTKWPESVIVRCSGLPTTTSCRRAYLLTLENIEDARRIFPQKKVFLQGELELAAFCRRQINEGEAIAIRRIKPLEALQSDREYQDLLYTACIYLLDCDSSVTRTAEELFLHQNTIKYRLRRIADLLGFRLGKMPETMEIYQSAAIYRLLNKPH